MVQETRLLPSVLRDRFETLLSAQFHVHNSRRQLLDESEAQSITVMFSKQYTDQYYPQRNSNSTGSIHGQDITQYFR